MFKLKCLIVSVLVILFACTNSQSIPQVKPVNVTLYALTDYTITYFSIKSLELYSEFNIDFSDSHIEVPTGDISCSTLLNDSSTSKGKC